MNKLIKDLNEEISKFRELCINKTITEELSNAFAESIVSIAINIYKDENIKFYIPCLDNGEQAIYNEEDRYYVPIYSDTSIINDRSIKNYKEVTLKELCTNLYENIRTYADLESINNGVDTEYLISHIHELSVMMDYAKNNPKISGIMYEPFTDHIYGFETWQVQAILFKGMGVNTFTTFDSKTGEKTHEL